MDLKDWTFVQRQGARIPRHMLNKEMEAAAEKSQEIASDLMDWASTSLPPLRFKIKRPETDYEGDNPSRSERWGGEFITTISAEADPGSMMDGIEIVDRKAANKMMVSFERNMKRWGLKGDVEDWPGDDHDLMTELEAEDRRKGVSSYLLLEYHRGKIHLFANVTVKVGFG